MDFSLSDDLVELKERTERFVREQILPYESDIRQTAHGPAEELRRELVELGRRAGLLSPHVGREWGGLGLDHRAMAVVFEAAGYSPLGPVALNCFAPDEANMHLLEEVAEQHQKEEWLRPLAAGEIRSCFMMTEPAPGAGAGRRDDVSGADECAGDSHRAGARHPGPVYGRRPRGHPAGRASGARECGAGTGRRRLSLCPGAPRSGTADPLHA